MAVTHTSSFYDTTPGDGVDEIQWAKGLPNIGASEYGVKGAGDWKVTGVTGSPFTLAIAPGAGWCHGVMDGTDQQDTLSVPTLTTGTRWDFISNRYDWKPTGGGPTMFASIVGSGQQIPDSRKNLPGDEVDQPLALVQWTAGQTQPSAIIDLRCWAGNGGMVIADILARDYLERPGADVLLGSTTHRYTKGANGAWGWVEYSNTQTKAGPMAGAVKPDWAPLRTFTGIIDVSSGAGGENRAAANATDGLGVGGLWFGYNQLPTFQGIYSVQLTGYHPLQQFMHLPAFMAVSTSRIKFKSRRLDGSGWANGYGSISMNVTVVGW